MKKTSIDIDRRHFMLRLGRSLGGVLLFVMGCGQDSTTKRSSSSSTATPTPSTTSGDCSANGATGSVNLNHGHSLSISANDILTALAKSYTIQGTADHNHSVVLSAENFNNLKNGENVVVISNSGASSTATTHTHQITLVCAFKGNVG